MGGFVEVRERRAQTRAGGKPHKLAEFGATSLAVFPGLSLHFK